MTTERDLDFRLAAWLDERATTGIPDDLLARSLARVDRVRQRPSILTAGAYQRPWLGAGRAPLAAPLLVILALALAILMVIVGSQLVVPRLTVVVPPTSSPGPQRTAPATDEPLPTILDTRPPGVPAQAGMFATASQLEAFGDQVAWVVTDTVIYRTEDRGATWRAVQPAGWTRPYSEAFVDAETAYVPIGQGSEIAVTHDGGASWATIVLDAPGAGSPVFAFASASTGYATFVNPKHYDKKDGTGLLVFGTTDGGETWTGPTPGLQPHLEATSNKLYAAIGPYLVNSSGLSAQYPFENYFDLSRDGGVTYTRYAFPSGTLAPRKDMKTVDAIVPDPAGDLLIAIEVYADRKGFPRQVYRYGDDPSRWTSVAQLPGLGDQPLQLVSPTTWVLTDGAPSRILSTTDSGATWRTIIPPFSLYDVQAGFGMARWTGVDTGWVADRCQDLTHRDDGSPTGYDCGNRGRDLVLLVTADGGTTWTRIGS